MGKKGTAVLGLGIAGLGVYILSKAQAEGSQGGKPVKILNVEAVPNEDSDLFWRFDATYQNVSEESRSFSIIMQVKDRSGKVIALQERRLSIAAGETELFQWNFIFLEEDRGNNTIQFFVWESLEDPIVLSNSKTISLN